MRNLYLLGIASLAAGCSASDGPDKPTQCGDGTFAGTYLIHLIERSGNCGPVADVLTRTDGSGSTAAGDCTLDEPNAYTNGNCTVTSAITCDYAAGVLHETTVLTWQDPEPRVLKGKLTASVGTCLSTYDVTWTKQ